MSQGPLNPADLSQARKALHALSELQYEIERAEMVGADVREYKDRRDHQYQRLMQILAVYGEATKRS